ncbi:MAG: isoleucine--tRNA ligase [Patescibacteria group bacterium]
MYNSSEQEREILKYWDEHHCFEKSVSERPENKPYHFYDGPPFATGLPHYGHLVASLMKDVVPRFWTMRGFRVERRWGWDCHGLPVENLIEQKLNLGSKKEIEDYGVDKFNEECRATVLMYANEWKSTVRRMGRWVDMENDYKTMDPTFMESIWWVFKELWKKKLIYKGHKPMHICPHCVTPLSNFEVTQNYKDIKDISATVKFKLKNPEKLDLDGDVYVLAWTTTPWTLPGNVLLAVGPQIGYQVVEIAGEVGVYILAADRATSVLKDKQYSVIKNLSSSDLVGLEYEPLFPYFADTPKAFRVVAGNFVSTEDGTGVVHIAPAFGEDDYNVGEEEGLPLVQHVTMEGKFMPAVTDFPNMDVKPKDDPTRTDVEVIKWLAHNNKLFAKEKIEHSYPHCWRCDTPLLNYATSSWFVKVTELKDHLLKNNKGIHWVPEHIKEGRFGKWLEGARDWAISRNRYWGTPLPVWESAEGDLICVGSAAELTELSGQKVTDLHKHIIDKYVIKKDGKEYRRIPEILDVWFESGSMPYGQMHYPFENQKKFENGFPAEFIAEGQDQTRGWFYTLHVLATALKNKPAFKNVIVNGIVLAEDGKKMSKRLKNYPEPDIVLEKYGADAMRYYLATSPVMTAESLNFSEIGVREMYNKVVNTAWNVLEFYKMYAVDQKVEDKIKKADNVLDSWILSKLQLLIRDATKGMENYELVNASRPILEFVTELSQWYVRRSRDRFKGDDGADKKSAITTLGYVLLQLSKVMAPFTPFIAEKIYLALGGEKESVHLDKWPEVNEKLINKKLMDEMDLARKVVELGLALRAEKGIKVRQPLSRLILSEALSKDLYVIIADELNVKKVEMGRIEANENFTVKEDTSVKVGLDIMMTEELKKEGIVRELVRTINQMRKDQKLTINDAVVVKYTTSDDLLGSVFSDYADEIKKSVLAVKIEVGAEGEEVEIGGGKVKLNVERPK